MQSWQSVSVPTIDGAGPPLRLWDSATDEISPAGASDEPLMYVCGITPYDATHLGHAATYVAFDLVNRYWRDQGKTVRYIQNVTDVDDPLIERAERDGIRWEDLAVRETDLFRSDMVNLRVLPPDHYMGAVETIPLVIDVVQRLLASGHAYRLPDGSGDIYFDVSRDPRFGYVSQYDEPTMLTYMAERGGDPDREGKRNRLDPLLWKGKREGDPSWDSPIGEGRPGWHVECAAIALHYLGDSIDVQGGGSDLRFPHHEMSVAHAEALTGDVPFSKHYTQAGMIGYDGHKMSKSLGNLVLVSKSVAAGEDPMAIRLALLMGHYRDDREWSDTLLREAAHTLEQWRLAVARPTAPEASTTISRMRESLSDDLDTAGVVAVVSKWATESASSSGSPTAGAEIAAAVDALLGIKL